MGKHKRRTRTKARVGSVVGRLTTEGSAAFKAACKKGEVVATTRQWRKFQAHRGEAWQAHERGRR